MLPSLAESVLCVQYDAKDFCCVFLLVNCAMWRSLYSRKQIIVAPKKSSNAECSSGLGVPIYVAFLLIVFGPEDQKHYVRSGSDTSMVEPSVQME